MHCKNKNIEANIEYVPFCYSLAQQKKSDSPESMKSYWSMDPPPELKVGDRRQRYINDYSWSHLVLGLILL